ncbi:MAG: DUF58 domain-containing protein [Planctomycetaceae bacterium]|nr:DUF58 domain-containing protein [Planctomycetaceae bacterium]
MRQKTPEYMQLLPSEIQAQFSRVAFSPNRQMLGAKAGVHRSPALGTSTEFAEHREYSPGDDPADLDWRVFGKLDRYYVRQYVEETNLRVTLMLDTSASMGFRGQRADSGFSRLDYACRLAALLSSIFLSAGDAVGLVLFDRCVATWLPAGSRMNQLRTILQTLHAARPRGTSAPASVMHQVAERLPGRGVVFLISDLLSGHDSLSDGLHHLRERRHQISVLHTLADEELTFPYSSATRFQDLEDPATECDVDPEGIRREYLERFHTYLQQLERVCQSVPAEYTLFNTHQAYDAALRRYCDQRWGTRQ